MSLKCSSIQFRISSLVIELTAVQFIVDDSMHNIENNNCRDIILTYSN